MCVPRRTACVTKRTTACKTRALRVTEETRQSQGNWSGKKQHHRPAGRKAAQAHGTEKPTCPDRHEAHSPTCMFQLSTNDHVFNIPTHLPTLARLPATTTPLPLLRENNALPVVPTAGAATKACVPGAAAAASTSSNALASAVQSLILTAPLPVFGLTAEDTNEPSSPISIRELKGAWRRAVGCLSRPKNEKLVDVVGWIGGGGVSSENSATPGCTYLIHVGGGLSREMAARETRQWIPIPSVHCWLLPVRLCLSVHPCPKIKIGLHELHSSRRQLDRSWNLHSTQYSIQ